MFRLETQAEAANHQQTKISSFVEIMSLGKLLIHPIIISRVPFLSPTTSLLRIEES